jgi:hypothetical protein
MIKALIMRYLLDDKWINILNTQANMEKNNTKDKD